LARAVLGGIGVVEIPWIVGKLILIVVARVILVARTGEAHGLRGRSGREIVELPMAADIAEIVRFGIVVRRFVGGLVRIRSSVPTHADALPRARSPPQA
jgi:hypothetical protein